MRNALFTGLLALGCLLGNGASAREYSVLVIRVDFPYEEPDHDTTSGRGAFDLSDYASDPAVQSRYFNPWDVTPHDRRYFDNHMKALDHYWRTVSEDRVSLRWNILPEDSRGAYRMANTFYKYGNGRTTEQTYRKLAELFGEAVETCKRTEGSRVDFSRYDTIMIIHAGVGQETSGGLNDIPSAFLNPADFEKYLGGPLRIDGVPIDTGIILPEMASENGLGGLNGIMAQMFGHRLGLPSLSNNKEGLPAAGGWSLMDTGGMAFGYTSRGFAPTHPDIWSKIEMGWIQPVVAAGDTTIDIAATHVNNGLPRAVKIPLTADEYLLIENRERYASRDSLPEVTFSDTDTSGVWLGVNHYDAFIPGSGILIWRINERIIAEKRTNDGINNDRYRRGVDLLEADGRQDIGAAVGFGDPRGEYTEGHEDDTFKKGGRDTLSPNSEPNSGSMWGGASGVTVKVNSAPGDIMNVRISFAAETARIPVSSSARGLTSADLDGDGTAELIVTGNDTLTVADHGRNRTAVLSDVSAHPAAIEVGGTNLLAIVQGNAVRFLTLDDSGLTTAASIMLPGDGLSIPEPVGDPVFTRTVAGDHLLVAVLFNKDGVRTGSGIMDISLKEYPALSVTSLPIPDNADEITRLAASGDFIAAAGENGFLYILNRSSGFADSHVIPSGPVSGLVIADFDRDGSPDAVVSTGKRLVFAKGKGVAKPVNSPLLPSFTKEIDLFDYPVGEPSVADIDNDGFPEIVLSTATRILAYRANGVPAEGFPRSLPPGDSGESIVSQPVIADLDANGSPDIAVATSNHRLMAIDAAGKSAGGFPLLLTAPVASNSSPLIVGSTGSVKSSIAWIDSTGSAYLRNLPAAIDSKSLLWPMWRGGPGLAASLSDSAITAPVQETASFEVFCYPNPITGSAGTFRIVPESRTDCRITVFSADGKKVFEHYLPEGQVIPGTPNEVRMDASSLASGLYIARIQTRTRTENYKLGVLK